MPLRTRLVITLVLLVAVALVAIEAITYNSIQSSLVSTVDSQMKSSTTAWESYFESCFRAEQCPQYNFEPLAFDSVQPDTYGALYTIHGQLVSFTPGSPGGPTGNPQLQCSPSSCPSSRPELPKSILAGFVSSGSPPEYATVGGTLQTHSYRVFASVIQGEETNSFGQAQVVNFVLVVAFPLTAVNHTMGHILELELIIGAAVLLALALMSWFFVQLELRPLERMTATASEIAAGDLTRRIEDTDERTEVGQLGAALNVMLTQIERAFREREASEARLRRFVGDASHELRTPLTSIRGYAELFKNGPVGRPEDLAAALGRIESESTRMGGLVDDLLLLARLDQGRPLGHDRVDLSQLAADAVLDAGVVNPSRSVRLVSAGPGVVVGDDQRLRQVLGNLLTNAMAYSPPESPIEVAVHVDHAPIGVPGLRDIPSPSSAGRFGRLNRGGRSSGQITPAVAPPRPLGATDLTLGPDGEVSENSENGVSTVTGPVAAAPAGRDDDVGRDGAPPVPADQPAGEWARAAVTVEVIDHGPGIPPEMLPFVFERFWRADESRQRSSGGSGLGLSIVAAVVAAHGGRVTIRQTPGGGATFVVELPAAPAAFPGPAGLHTLTGPDVGNGVSSSVPGVIEVAGVPGATGLEE